MRPVHTPAGLQYRPRLQPRTPSATTHAISTETAGMLIAIAAPENPAWHIATPDAAALAYLRVIEREPEAVERALAAPPSVA